MRITYHALDRYREHHPNAENSDVQVSVAWGSILSPAFVQALLGRIHVDRESMYKASPDHHGVFVIRDGWVITYLRLQESQRNILLGKPAKPLIVTPTPVTQVVVSKRPDLDQVVPAFGISLRLVHPPPGVNVIFGSVTTFREKLLGAVALGQEGGWVKIDIDGVILWCYPSGDSMACFTEEGRTRREAKEQQHKADRLLNSDDTYYAALAARYNHGEMAAK